ncbi:MAG: metallophosphatase domain-containing protein [Polyangiaceae bacterium]
MRLVLLSDTHRQHDAIRVPPGDVLVHAGDFCGHGTVKQAEAFADFVVRQPHRYKVVIAGNHDRCLEMDPELGPRLFPKERGCHYLFDSGVVLDGVRFWGSPWQPWFLDWAFNLQRGAPLRAKWDLIPSKTDVLVTHGPPHQVRDRCEDGHLAGCEELALALQRVQPRVHVFGHIHEGYGVTRVESTLFCNASICTLAYTPSNPPLVVDLVDGEARLVSADA